MSVARSLFRRHLCNSVICSARLRCVVVILTIFSVFILFRASHMGLNTRLGLLIRFLIIPCMLIPLASVFSSLFRISYIDFIFEEKMTTLLPP